MCWTSFPENSRTLFRKYALLEIPLKPRRSRSPPGVYATTMDHLTLLPDDRLLAAGNVTLPGGSDSILSAYLPDGTLDTTFGPADSIFMPGVVATDTAVNG